MLISIWSIDKEWWWLRRNYLVLLEQKQRGSDTTSWEELIRDFTKDERRRMVGQPPAISMNRTFASWLVVTRRFVIQNRGALRAQRPSRWLDRWGAILPPRIVNEELGDYIEDINRRASEGQSAIWLWLRAGAAVFWTLINAVGYWKTQLGRKRTSQ